MPSNDHRNHRVALSDDDRSLIDAALAHYAKTQGFEIAWRRTARLPHASMVTRQSRH